MQDGGLDLGDGGIPLLDLRFADDILLFATSRVEGTRMVDALVTCLKEVGLALNASKPRIPTTQAQSGKTVTTQNGLEMEILDATKAHKWLGCLLSTFNAGNTEADLDFRVQATSKVFYADKRILCDNNVSFNSHIKFFWFCGDFGGPFWNWSGQVRSGQLACPDGSPVLGRKQLYTKRNTTCP